MNDIKINSRYDRKGKRFVLILRCGDRAKGSKFISHKVFPEAYALLKRIVTGVQPGYENGTAPEFSPKGCPSLE